MSNVFSFHGTVGRDAEVRYAPSGVAVLNVTVANNIGFGDKQQTLWIRVVLFGKRAAEQHHWETSNHQLGIGIGLGLLSALCQAVSTLMLKPLMETDIDAIAASAVPVRENTVSTSGCWAIAFSSASCIASDCSSEVDGTRSACIRL